MSLWNNGRLGSRSTARSTRSATRPKSLFYVEEEVNARPQQQNSTDDPFGGDQAKDAAAAALIVRFRHSETPER